MIPEGATKVKLLQRQVWREGLVSLRFEKPEGFTFTPGQFIRLGLEIQDKGNTTYVGRAYSMTSSPSDPFVEFLIVSVPDGLLSTRLTQLEAGSEVWMEKELWGAMLPRKIPGGDTLWCIASGTGLAPFISILKSEDTWKQWPNVVLVHSVRFSEDLCYTNAIENFADNSVFGGSKDHSFCYLPVVTREATQFLSKRIPELIESGSLEDSAERKLDPESSRVLICGNPQMVQDTRDVLKKLGFKSPRRGNPGNLLAENLW